MAEQWLEATKLETSWGSAMTYPNLLNHEMLQNWGSVFPREMQYFMQHCFLIINWIFGRFFFSELLYMFFSWLLSKSETTTVGFPAFLKTTLHIGGHTGGPKKLSSWKWFGSCPGIQWRHNLKCLFKEPYVQVTYLWGERQRIAAGSETG